MADTNMHSFNAEFAVRYGIEAALIFGDIYFWCIKNKENDINLKKGSDGKERYYTFNSLTDLQTTYKYMSISKVYRVINELEAEGLIITGCFNKRFGDRTRWYAVTEKGEKIFLDCVKKPSFMLYEHSQLSNCNLQNETNNLQNETNNLQNETNNLQNEMTLPNSNSDTNSNSDSDTKSADTKPNKNICEESKKLCELLCKYCKRDNPRFSKKPEIIKKWTEEIGRAHFLDNYAWEEIERCIHFAKNDSFWNSNILSGDKLRKQMEQLYVKSQKNCQNSNQQGIKDKFTGEEYRKWSDDPDKVAF